MPSLEPPNRGALWLSLALTQAQLAKLCGVSKRQVQHWTKLGYLTTRPGSDHYNGNAVDLCLLIRQELDQGLSLNRAVAVARDYLADAAHQRPSLATLGPEALLEIREQLVAALAMAASVREVVEARVPTGAGGEP